MSSQQAEILFICGSPRARSSEALLSLLEQGVREVGARSRRFLLSKKYIAPCIGCGYCEKTGTCILADENSKLYADDDYAELLEALNYADALAVVSPLFFSGPPAQLKALYDRMQPFWARKYILGQEPPDKRPAQVFILGGGGDPHGYEPMVTISRGALAVAGFTLEKIQNFIGFKFAKDVAPLPTDEEAAEKSYGELARLRKAAATQREFEQRALAAGSAFARFVNKSLDKGELQAKLQLVEAELTEMQSDDPLVVITPSQEVEADIEPVKIVNLVDSEFEALKQTARASKSPKANQAELDAIVEEAVAALTDQHAERDNAKIATFAISDTPSTSDGSAKADASDTSDVSLTTGTNTNTDNTKNSDTSSTSSASSTRDDVSPVIQDGVSLEDDTASSAAQDDTSKE